MSQSEIVLFEEKQVRKIWFKEEWHFSVVDVVNVLVVSQTKDISGYWRTMKKRLKAENPELTEERKERGVSSQTDYAILTNEIMHAAFNMTVEEYKSHKLANPWN
jgi:prophage antirepressor-like protein